VLECHQKKVLTSDHVPGSISGTKVSKVKKKGKYSPCLMKFSEEININQEFTLVKVQNAQL
jgi:hypothetical protein